MDKSVQEGFRAWFLGSRPEHQVERVFILALGKVGDVQSQESATPSETVGSPKSYKAMVEMELQYENSQPCLQSSVRAQWQAILAIQ